MMKERRNSPLPLDGTQRPRLVNMRSRTANSEAQSQPDNFSDDFLSMVHGQLFYRLNYDRASSRKALEHWFMRGQAEYQVGPTIVSTVDSVRLGYVRDYLSGADQYVQGSPTAMDTAEHDVPYQRGFDTADGDRYFLELKD